MSEFPTLSEMLKAGVHFGHKKSKRHPEMQQYIYDMRNGIHIISLEKTAEKLKEALTFMEETAAKGGMILLLGTKHQARDIIKKYCEEIKMPYVSERWLGGTFTNFSVILTMIKKLKKLEENKKTGEFKKYTKKEQLKFDREIEKLEKTVGGMKDMTRIPDAIFIVDITENKIAVNEAVKMKVPVIAMVDTNNNPRKADYPIPANNDAIRSLEMIIGLAAGAIKKGQGRRPAELQQPKAKGQGFGRTEVRAKL